MVLEHVAGGRLLLVEQGVRVVLSNFLVEQAAAELDMGLTALRHDDLKVAFFKGKPAVYEALARIALGSGRAKHPVERAYNWCERAKSRSLIDLLSQHVRAIRAGG